MKKMNVVITGATKGIGLAIAHAFAGEGCNLAICARNNQELETLARALEQGYPDIEIQSQKVDIASKDEVYSFADNSSNRWATIDVLVNNAGAYLHGRTIDDADGVLEDLIRTNLYGAYYLTRRLLPAIRNSSKPHIFNICSIASTIPYPESGSYSISKYAMLGFSKVLRDELRDEGIRVTSVYPGATRNSVSPDLPDGHIMPAEDIASAIINAWKLSGASVVEDLVIRPQYGHL